MSSFRKLSLIRAEGLSLMIVEINNERHTLVNRETKSIIREINRLLGLRRCRMCGQLVKAEELGYVEIVNNKVTRAVCQRCMAKIRSSVVEVLDQCLSSR